PNKDDINVNGGKSVADDPCKGRCDHVCVGNDICTCMEGYKLKPDGQRCEDINECLLGSSNCRGGERCINTEGSFRCMREVSCGTGYELTENNDCKDIDECETGIHNCGEQFECQNSQGSFRCVPKTKCGEGFIQDALGSCIGVSCKFGSTHVYSYRVYAASLFRLRTAKRIKIKSSFNMLLPSSCLHFGPTQTQNLTDLIVTVTLIGC
ncbi:hypothetical protein ATANTOWER_017150, partial [Ataeniobius toweri]|nr:hypothetical protein [Ataeniobius toweri]